MKKLWFICLLLMVVFIVGCTKGEKTTGRFAGGTEGLDITFIQDEPPDKVLDKNQDQFDITLLLTNKGEYTIPKGKVIASLSGISSDAFSLSSLNAILNTELAGKTKEIEGESEELQFSKAKYKYDLQANADFDVVADVCYLYQTKAVSSLCFKREASKRNDEDSCDINNEKISVDNSGSPLQIKDVKEKASGTNEVKITFTIEKKSGGDVYETNAFSNSCSGQEDKKDKLTVEVNSDSGRLSIKCDKLGDSNRGTIKLISGKRTLTCRIITSSAQDIAFKEPINIKLDYFFRDAVSKTITVENSEE